ncbi:HNH endonuclease family protein [Streptomyces atroolivaceus]|uniref:HNH endonuclease family protein n=1 Tax=Streptomyces atroolivaceus TaxID=66869 RepID=UPI003660BD8C
MRASEAVNAPEVAAGCKLTGGSWRSAYDNLVVSDASRLDVDHFVPLAEVYDSEQTPWSAERREAYANDQGSADTLIAVSAASNRSKSDKDPAQWMPTDASYHCTYAATWVATKLRWDLAVDDVERQALLGTAEDCSGTTVSYEFAPWPRLTSGPQPPWHQAGEGSLTAPRRRPPRDLSLGMGAVAGQTLSAPLHGPMPAHGPARPDWGEVADDGLSRGRSRGDVHQKV